MILSAISLKGRCFDFHGTVAHCNISTNAPTSAAHSCLLQASRIHFSELGDSVLKHPVVGPHLHLVGAFITRLEISQEEQICRFNQALLFFNTSTACPHFCSSRELSPTAVVGSSVMSNGDGVMAPPITFTAVAQSSPPSFTSPNFEVSPSINSAPSIIPWDKFTSPAAYNSETVLDPLLNPFKSFLPPHSIPILLAGMNSYRHEQHANRNG